jgi:hypothetical protein
VDFGGSEYGGAFQLSQSEATVPFEAVKETMETPAGVQGYIVWHYFVVFGESMYAWDGAGIQTYAFSDDAEGSNGDTMDERYARVEIDGRTMMFKGFGNSTPQQQNQPASSFFGDDGITA